MLHGALRGAGAVHVGLTCDTTGILAKSARQGSIGAPTKAKPQSQNDAANISRRAVAATSQPVIDQLELPDHHQGAAGSQACGARTRRVRSRNDYVSVRVYGSSD